ncbi:MAG: hypothetical protein ABI175_07660 [Polyangiales bacterium]
MNRPPARLAGWVLAVGLVACRRRVTPSIAIVADDLRADAAAEVDAARVEYSQEDSEVVEFPLHIDVLRPFPPPRAWAAPEALTWSEHGSPTRIVDKRVEPVSAGGELVHYYESSGWPGPEILELRRGGKRIAYYSNVWNAETSSTGEVVFAQDIGKERQLIVLDLATARATLLPHEDCSSEGARWYASGTRVVTYGRHERWGETFFCLLDDSFAVNARVTGDVRWDPHDNAIDVDPDLLPREAGYFYLLDNMRSELVTIELEGPGRAWYAFDAGGWYAHDLGGFTFGSPVIRADQHSDDGRWKSFTGRPLKLKP